MKFQNRKRIIYYRENDRFSGWIAGYPNFRTQGIAIIELIENLKDIYGSLNARNGL